MGVDSPNCVGTQTGAVFLSYASQDAEAAFRMRDALRAGGIEVWLDQSELRGGDAWDRRIRERIHDGRLFIALISAHTEARDEGYFRREWKLAVDRTHDMLEKKAFLLPVAIDATPERGAAVPDKFHEVQWTRLSGGEAPPEFVARIKRLVSPESPTTAGSPAGAGSRSKHQRAVASSKRSRAHSMTTSDPPTASAAWTRFSTSPMSATWCSDVHATTAPAGPCGSYRSNSTRW